MTRRSTVNTTGITRLDNVPYHDAWVGFKCVKCKKQNHIIVGKRLLDSQETYNNAKWKCEHCGFIHSKNSDLSHFSNWEKKFTKSTSEQTKRFWEAFFRTATENPNSYWKQCNVCGRILPFAAFSKHSGWGPLERQMECRSCKGAINAKLNPLRTAQQLHESSVRRRVAELLVKGENSPILIDDLFKRFGSRCFKTNKKIDIKNRKSWAIDHILPSRYLYPLSIENAALLSREANDNKNDAWPSKFYTNNELIKLARITGANLDLLCSPDPVINKNIDVNACVTRYLMVREGSNLSKRITELKKLIQAYDLENKLSNKNKKILGL